MEPGSERDAAGLWRNGSFSLGLARRCSLLLGSDLFEDEIAACRKLLRELGTRDRRRGAGRGRRELAVRAASALVAAGGGRSVLASEHAQRLAREAMFLLVFGQTAGACGRHSCSGTSRALRLRPGSSTATVRRRARVGTERQRTRGW